MATQRAWHSGRTGVMDFINQTSDKPPYFLKQRSSRWFITMTVAISIFCDLFLYGVIVPVVPFALEVRSGISPDQIQSWVSILLSVYGATLLVGSGIWGWASDKTESRRMPFLAGLLLLIGATAMLCAGSSISVILAGRALQGASSAVVWVTGLVIICDTVGQRHVGEAMGYVGLAMSVAVLLAPLLGGIVYDRAGYYAVFAMCFGILGFDVILRLLMIEVSVAKRWIDIEIDSEDDESQAEKQMETADKQATTDTDTTVSHPSPQPAPLTNTTPPTSSFPADSAAQPPPRHITLDPTASPRLHSRLPPIFALLGSPRLLAALWCTLVQAILLTAFDSTLPLRVRALFNWNSLGAGLIFIPLILPSFSGPLIGKISDTRGGKVPTVAGFVLSIPFLVLLRLVEFDSMRQKVLLCALLTFYGLSTTMCLMPLMAEVSLVVEEQAARKPEGYYGKQGAYASAYGLFNMAFAGGCLAGPLWGGLVNSHAGWATMTWTLAVLSAFTAVVGLAYVGGLVTKKGSVWQKGGSNAHIGKPQEGLGGGGEGV